MREWLWQSNRTEVHPNLGAVHHALFQFVHIVFRFWGRTGSDSERLELFELPLIICRYRSSLSRSRQVSRHV